MHAFHYTALDPFTVKPCMHATEVQTLGVRLSLVSLQPRVKAACTRAGSSFLAS